MKGINGHKGLESFHEIQAVNLGAQVACEEVIRKIHDTGADAVLISQVVTQKNIHVTNLTKLVDMLEAEGLREKVILVVGGRGLPTSWPRSWATTQGSGRIPTPSMWLLS